MNHRSLINLANAHIQSAYDIIEMIKVAAEEIEVTDEERAITREEAAEQGILENLEFRYELERLYRDLISAVKSAGQGTRETPVQLARPSHQSMLDEI